MVSYANEAIPETETLYHASSVKALLHESMHVNFGGYTLYRLTVAA